MTPGIQGAAHVVLKQTTFETPWHGRLDSWTVQVAMSHNFVSEMGSSSNLFCLECYRR
jgi:hypothetical protein